MTKDKNTKWRGFGRLIRDERGVAAVAMVGVLPVAVGMAAMVEFGLVHSMRVKLQAAADASAAAAILQMPDDVQAKATAVAFGELNMPVAVHGNVITTPDVLTGTYDAATDTFTVDANGEDVHVTAQRSEGRGNQLALLLLGGILGGGIDLFANSIAVKSEGGGADHPCEQFGVIARGDVDLGEHTVLAQSFCVYAGGKLTLIAGMQILDDTLLYGDEGADILSFNIFYPGSELALPPGAPLYEGSFNFGVAAAERRITLTVGEDNQPSEDIAAMLDGSFNWPDHLIGPVLTVSQLPVTPLQNRIYRVTGPVDIASYATLSNVGIIADGAVTIGGHANIQNSVIGSAASIDIASHTTIGSDFCNSGEAVRLVSGGAVDLGAFAQVSGVHMQAVGDVEIGAHMGGTAFSAVIDGDLELNASSTLMPCANGNTAAPQTEPNSVLVN